MPLARDRDSESTEFATASFITKKRPSVKPLHWSGTSVTTFVVFADGRIALLMYIQDTHKVSYSQGSDGV